MSDTQIVIWLIVIVEKYVFTVFYEQCLKLRSFVHKMRNFSIPLLSPLSDK